MRRLIAAVLAIATGVNGLAMLLAGPLWYESVPGASETGPLTRISSRISARHPSLPVYRSPCGHGGLDTGRRRWPAPAFWRHTP